MTDKHLQRHRLLAGRRIAPFAQPHRPPSPVVGGTSPVRWPRLAHGRCVHGPDVRSVPTADPGGLRVGSMRIDRRFLGWGVFLVIVGAIPLAVRAGYLTSDQMRTSGGCGRSSSSAPASA